MMATDEQNISAAADQLIDAPSPQAMLRVVSSPATFSNKVYLTPFPTMARLTFVERIDDIEAVRGSFALMWPDVVALKELLDRYTKELTDAPLPEPPKNDG